MKLIQFSLVCYNTSRTDFENVIRSISLSSLSWKLTIIDNSLVNSLESLISSCKNIEYIHRPDNPGFGAAHNIAISKSIQSGADYHFVVNPDVFFKYDVVSPMVNYIMNNPEIGMMMPQILNLDGSVQQLPKLLPSPFSIFWRKVKRPSRAYQKFINRYELREVPPDVIYNAPVLSGCFTLLNLSAIKDVGMYDDRFFMYFEDWDLSRRVHVKYRTLYYPHVSVFHGYDSGANKSFKLFKIFLSSAFSYFNKWGWFLEEQRNVINSQALSQFK